MMRRYDWFQMQRARYRGRAALLVRRVTAWSAGPGLPGRIVALEEMSFYSVGSAHRPSMPRRSSVAGMRLRAARIARNGVLETVQACFTIGTPSTAVRVAVWQHRRTPN